MWSQAIFHNCVVIFHFFLLEKMHASTNKCQQIFYLSYLFFKQQWTSGRGLVMAFVTSEWANMVNTWWTVNKNFQTEWQQTSWLNKEWNATQKIVEQQYFLVCWNDCKSIDNLKLGCKVCTMAWKPQAFQKNYKWKKYHLLSLCNDQNS